MFQNATGASETPAGTNAANSTAFTPNASATPNATPSDTAPSSTASSESTNQFLRLGQQLAQQMRSMNPELVDQLRQSFQNIFPPGSTGSTDAPH
ncbi:unnamed protein product [Dicrocoelium dendriticum]|nr:unnamed protein product [Dicrocoelium dendriticum]